MTATAIHLLDLAIAPLESAANVCARVPQPASGAVEAVEND